MKDCPNPGKMGTLKRKTRRLFRRLTHRTRGRGPGVAKLAPGDPEYCEYARYLYSPRRMIMSNFVAGLARGIGMAVGFSLLGAAVVYLLQSLAWQNLGVIGEYIAKIIAVVEAKK
jgi:hypothetical protein